MRYFFIKKIVMCYVSETSTYVKEKCHVSMLIGVNMNQI